MKQILSQKGMSLVEVLVAAGALAVVSLGVMKLMETTGKANVTAVANNDIAQMTREISGILSSPNSCQASLGGFGPGDTVPFIYQVNQTNANNPQVMFEPGKVRIGNQFVNPTNQLYVDRITVKTITPNEQFNNVAKIEIFFKRPQSSMGGQDISREITLSTNHCEMNYIQVPYVGDGTDITALLGQCTTPRILVSGPTNWGNSFYWGTCRDCTNPTPEIKHCHAMDSR